MVDRPSLLLGVQLPHRHDALLQLVDLSLREILVQRVDEGLLDGRLKVRPLVMPDAFIEQAKPETMNALAGIDRKGIVTSFVLCGIVAIAGKRGSAPTMMPRR